jgi:HSP20 family protein
MNRIKIDIQKDVERMQNRIDQMFERLIRQAKSFSLLADNVWRPALDVYETADAVILLMEIAGVNREDFEIVLERDYLVIRGQRRDLSSEHKVRLHQMEIDYGVFERAVHLSIPYQEDGISASYEDGFLKITIPKKAAQPPGKIDISS